MFRLLKRLKCTHIDVETITNVYGDAINYYNCRSIRRCKNCGKLFYMGLDKDCDIVNNFKEGDLSVQNKLINMRM